MIGLSAASSLAEKFGVTPAWSFDDNVVLAAKPNFSLGRRITA
jgi:hypothetical protein